MKVTTDSCLFGAWVANNIKQEGLGIQNCIDIGTGTGLLSLMLSQKNKLSIEAIEIDEAAAKQAAENIEHSPWCNSITVQQCDIKNFYSEKKYDCIISNPPFYESDLKGSNQQKNIAHHNEGLKLPELLHIIYERLSDNGIFFLLLPYKRYAEIKEQCNARQLKISTTVLVKQTAAHPYFRIIISGNKITAEQAAIAGTEEITITDSNKEYTNQFTELLRDYYLYL
jgi:tRNA1Val (adenine37-N6)-methyltransferase